MKYERIAFNILIILGLLLLFSPTPSRGQGLPDHINVTLVDSGQFPQMEVYVDAFAADGSRHIGLFADQLQFTEDGSERPIGMYDAPRGTWLTFLIDADPVAESQWEEIKSAILDYAATPWMDEDWDYVTVLVANGQKTETLVESSFHNAVANAFVLETGQAYKPPVVPITPLNDLVADVLSGWTTPAPTPGMYRALVVFSSGDAAASTRGVDGVVTLAQNSDIPIFPILVGQNPAGEQTLQQMARNDGGQFYRLDATSGLAELWETISSHRQQYVISYSSQIIASGTHAVKVQLSDTLQDTYSFEITVLNPQVEITLPKPNDVIQRQPLQPDDPSTEFDPKTQPVKYRWEWPDQHERNVTTVQLRVNGGIQQQLDLTTSSDRNLVWDIADLPPGPYSLRVEVIDELGLRGESLEVPVTLRLLSPTPSRPVATITATPRKSSGSSVISTVTRYLGIAGVSGLSLGALIALLFVFRGRLSSLVRSPVSFLRRLPVFRPFDQMLRNVERVAGPVRGKLPKVRLPGTKKKPKVKAPGAEKKPSAWLEVVQGQSSSRGPVAIESEIAFGRSAERAQVVFADRTVSRLHARIVPEHGGTYRVFNHSQQGTWVNEQRVPEYGLLLKDGDTIRMGQVQLRFRVKKR